MEPLSRDSPVYQGQGQPLQPGALLKKESKQRIKLRCEGSPVKMDGTVIECSQDGKRIKVRFDGPQEDTVLYAYGEHKMVSNMTTTGGQPTEDTRLMLSGLWWEVL